MVFEGILPWLGKSSQKAAVADCKWLTRYPSKSRAETLDFAMTVLRGVAELKAESENQKPPVARIAQLVAWLVQRPMRSPLGLDDPGACLRPGVGMLPCLQGPGAQL